MGTSTRRSKSNGPVIPIASAFQKTIPPSARFGGGGGGGDSPSSSSSFYASSSSSSFSSSRTTGFFSRPTSPTRVNLHGFAPIAPLRFSIDRSKSPSRSVAVSPRDRVVRVPTTNRTNSKKQTCMCSPTTHPGSFRCSLHKNTDNRESISYSANRLNARRSAMANSLVRIGTVEGDWVKRALAQLIRPSSHHQRRRADFQPRRSRLWMMSKAGDP